MNKTTVICDMWTGELLGIYKNKDNASIAYGKKYKTIDEEYFKKHGVWGIAQLYADFWVEDFGHLIDTLDRKMKNFDLLEAYFKK